MRPTLLLIIVCILLTACRRTSPQEKLLLACSDSIKETHPDSAFRLLKKIQNTHKLGSSDQALYALLMSEEMDKHGQYLESDSLIRIATEYYSKKNVPERTGYAYLYLSRIERNRGNARKQADALFKAISFAIESKNDKLLGYIYGEKASIYESQQNNNINEKKNSVYEAQQLDSMLYYHNLSLKCFKKTGDKYNTVISLIDVGYTHYLSHQYDSALHYTQLAKQEATVLNDPILLSTIYRLDEGIYFYQKNYPKALQSIRMAMKTSDFYDYSKWKLIAMIYLQTGQLDSVGFYLRKCIATGNELPDCYELSQELAEKKDLPSEALRYAKLAALAKDSVDKRTRAESFAGMEKKYNYERIIAENEHLIIRNQRYTIEVIIALLICTIITAFYLIEHNRKKKHMLLEENLRKTVAAKDKFFSIISHDLSNPFKALNRVSGLLYEQYPGMNETERLNAVRAINDTAGQAEKLLENLLLWSLTQKNDIPYRPRNIDLTDQLNSSIDLFVLTAQKKDIHLINSITESYSIEADPNMMSTILGNLIGNAIKFSYQDNKVIISAKDCGNLIEISVSDTGTGMSMEDQQRLFRLDTKIKQSGTQNEQGTGLGLILCREFIEKQGGKIWVESKLGKGTTFIFTVLKATDHETN